jgi:hypothetical protein
MTKGIPMGLLIVFSNHPNSLRKFLFGIEHSDTVKELAKLFNKTEAIILAGDITLQLPDKAALSKLTIVSVELKNILTNFAGEQIYIHPDFNQQNTKFSVSNIVLSIP